MKYLKIQQELIKAAVERDTKLKIFKYRYFETDEQIFITYPPYYCLISIPKELVLLDIDKIFLEENLIDGISLIKNSKNTKRLKNINTTVNHDSKKLHQFGIDDKVIYIKEKDLKWFDLNISEFTGSNEESPIYIWENRKLVGVVAPYVVKKGNI